MCIVIGAEKADADADSATRRSSDAFIILGVIVDCPSLAKNRNSAATRSTHMQADECDAIRATLTDALHAVCDARPANVCAFFATTAALRLAGGPTDRFVCATHGPSQRSRSGDGR